MVEVGETAPDFTLPDESGKEHTLSDYRGQRVVVYFYPKDDTPGCTKEACSFRDATDLYQQEGIKVFGISNDSVESHAKFKEKYNLTHTLLADEKNEVCPTYGAYGKKVSFGKERQGILRKTFLINEEGKVTKVYNKVKTSTHADDILEEYKSD